MLREAGHGSSADIFYLVVRSPPTDNALANPAGRVEQVDFVSSTPPAESGFRSRPTR